MLQMQSVRVYYLFGGNMAIFTTPLRIVAPVLLSFPLLAIPDISSAQGNLFGGIGKVLGEVEKQITEGTQALTQDKSTTLGAVLGGVAGASLSDNKLIGVVIGTSAGAFIGNQIGKTLNPAQQTQVSRSTVSAAVTGEDSTWKDTKSPARGSVKVVATETKAAPVSIPVSKEKVAEVPPLDFIGETYELTSNANVRGGPDTKYEKVGYLPAGSKVNVVGKVKNAEWYFISEDGVGSGFLFVELAKPSAASIIASPPPPLQEETYEAEIADEQLCRTMEQSVTGADGVTQSQTVTACKGANGWEMQPA